MKKRIGLLLPSLGAGGAERAATRLSKILCKDYEIFLILFEDTYIKYEYEGALVNLDIKARGKTVLRKALLPFKRAYKLRNVKRQLRLDVVISFLDSPNIVNILANDPHCKTVLSVRNYLQKNRETSTTAKVGDFFLKYIYKKADKIVSVSKVIEESLVEHYNVQRSKVRTIYNPFDIAEIQDLANERIPAPEEEFFNRARVFISVGRQMYQKGFWHLVKAFKLVHDQIPDTGLVLVGENYQKGALQKLADELHLSNSVLFAGYQENPFKYMKKSSVYVLSSMFEGFPNSMVEALACGCPVIAADCKSGPREILYKNADTARLVTSIEKADFGILVPELEAAECWDKDTFVAGENVLADAMKQMITDEALMQFYTKQGALRARDFNFEACKEQYMEIIEGS